jgi:hypothetical protein
MAISDMLLRDLAVQGAAVGGLGMLGRLMALYGSEKRSISLSLLWEIPTAIGMGIIGKGVAETIGTEGFQHYAIVIAIAYGGPRVVDLLLAKHLFDKDAKPLPRPPKKGKVAEGATPA